MSRVCPTCRQAITARTDKEHRTHFAAIRAAKFFWPEAHKFQPKSEEELRGWLYVETGHSRSIEMNFESWDWDARTKTMLLAVEAVEIARSLLRPGGYVQMENVGMKLVITAPASMSYAAMGRKAYRDATAKVHSLIEVTCGYAIERLIKEMHDQVESKAVEP